MKKYEARPELSKEQQQLLVTQPPFLAHLLWHRGVQSDILAQTFLNPNYETGLHDPFLIKDMKKAVERVKKAIANNEKVVIYSDYDADGIPGAVVLHDFFKKIGFANFSNYIPHRHNEGFGLNHDAIEKFIADGTNVLITIDCGIADYTEIEAATKAGIDVIVTDHHLPSEKMPPAFAILNSKQDGCDYPFNMLCGAGVVFKLVQALIKAPGEKKTKHEAETAPNHFAVKDGHEKWFLDMVGLATLSDMVPLQGENRVLAHYGLKVLRKSPRPGLTKLLSRMKVSQRDITEDDIGFMISPRINAASRMGVPMDAFRLLSTTDMTEADTLSAHLEEINNERKGIVAAMVKDMKKHLDVRVGSSEEMPAVIVIGNPLWKPALLGLAASSLVEAYNKPVFLWGRENGDGIKGSCRSDGSVSVVELMSEARDSLLDFGGHDMAGGFSVSHEKIHFLEQGLNDARKRMSERGEKTAEKNNDVIYFDKRLTFDDIGKETWRHIEKLAPFGVGNPKPLFLFQNAMPQSVKQFGKGRDHLELVFRNSRGMPVRAIAFFKTPESFSTTLSTDIRTPNKVTIEPGIPLNLLATIEHSMFGGRSEIRLRIVDIVPEERIN